MQINQTFDFFLFLKLNGTQLKFRQNMARSHAARKPNGFDFKQYLFVALQVGSKLRSLVVQQFVSAIKKAVLQVTLDSS